MKISEGLKRIKRYKNIIEKNVIRINEICSSLSNEKLLYDTEKEQEREVESLIQSNRDILKELFKLKNDIYVTNMVTQVKIKDMDISLQQVLETRSQKKNKTGHSDLMIQTFSALNDKAAEKRLTFNSTYQAEKRPVVIRHYSEKKKMESLRYWHDVIDEIEEKLEVINNTTDIVTVVNIETIRCDKE